MASKEKKINPQQADSFQAELIRRFKTNPLIFIGTFVVLVIVIVAFVFVPAMVPSTGGLGVDLSFGSYNKIPITYVPGNYFSQIRETLARDQDPAQGQSFVQNYEVWRRAFDETVVHTAILDEMKQAGYMAPPDAVDRKMTQLPRFQENGVFSMALYRALDKQSRMALWRQVQESIIEGYYREDITKPRISSKEASFISAIGSPQRTFALASFSLQNYPETEINAYALAHPELFQVTHLSQITITNSEREAQQVRASIQEGTTTFEDAARTHSQDAYAEKGGDMGMRMSYEFSDVPEGTERNALMKLVKGDLSPLIKVTTGWAFYRAEEEPRQADTSDAGLLEKIRIYIMTYERGQVEDFFLSQADTFIEEVKALGFDEALNQRGLKKQNFGPLPLNYGGTPLFNSLTNAGVPEIAQANTNENFWQTAFSTPLLTPSKSFVVDNNVVVLYPLEETQADETNTAYMETAYTSYLLSYFMEENIRMYFLNSKKFEDHFWDVYTKYFQPVN